MLFEITLNQFVLLLHCICQYLSSSAVEPDRQGFDFFRSFVLSNRSEAIRTSRFDLISLKKKAFDVKMLNRTLVDGPEVLDYYADRFPFPTDEDEFNVDLSNQTSYDDFIVNETRIWNETESDLPSLSTIFSFSSPFSYIILILIVYLILTLILLSFSLYKQRQSDAERFDEDESEEELQQAKRTLEWKQFLIGKISKGDMEPLLSTKDSPTYPLEIV